MADNYTIAETYTLPSEGKIYKVQVKPQVKIRSMTTEDEMKRLSHTETPYKILCDIIDDCIVEPIGISSYDMHLGDYQLLLHRLRVVTYGTDYPTSSICPVCGRANKTVLNLDDIENISPDENFKNLFNVTLPRTGRQVTLRFETPRDIDEISAEVKKFTRENPDSKLDINYLYTLKHIISTVDGKKLNPIMLEQFLRKLPLMDSNLIMQRAAKINEGVGINTKIKNHCQNPKCGVDYTTTFRVTSEFFGPSNY